MKNEAKTKIILVIALLGYWVIALTGCVRNDIKNINSRGKNIICFGDSITSGYGVDHGENYPSFLSKMLGMPVVNAGIDGDTSVGGLQRIEMDVLEREPLLVVIEFGGNDFLYKIPQELTIKNISEMIDRIQAKGAMVALVDVSADIFLNEYGPLFEKIAQEKGTIFIPKVFKGIIIDANLKIDFIHPNGFGYKIITHRIYRAILPYVNQNNILKRFIK